MAINQYACTVAHHLTESSIKQLLDLIELHCLPDNCCPQTIHQLRKHLGITDGMRFLQYCSGCLNEISTDGKKCCRQQCKDMSTTVCNFAILPFEDHLVRYLSHNFIR